MRTSYDKKFKPWKDVKSGDKIYYYDHGKLHEQTVHFAEVIEEVKTYNYGWNTTTSTEKKFVIKAGRGSIINMRESWMDKSFYPSYCFTRFTCKEAAIDALKNHLDKLKYRCESAQRKYERYLNSYNKYKSCIEKNEKIIANVE